MLSLQWKTCSWAEHYDWWLIDVTNSEEMKHTCHSKRCPISYIDTQCIHSLGNAGVYSRKQTVIKVPNVILRYIVPNIFHVLSKFVNGCGKLWKKSNFTLHHISYVLNWREICGSYWPEHLLYTTKSKLRSSNLCGHVLSCWISTSTPCLRNDSSKGVNNLCSATGTVYVTL